MTIVVYTVFDKFTGVSYMRIAIIDNDTFMLRDCAKLIKKVRPQDEVYPFEIGLDLLQFIMEKPCEVLFIEPYLEDMDGIMLVKEIKEMLPKVNVIFLTEYDSFYRAAMEVRASGYVLKPLREQDVKEEMQNLRFVPELKTNVLLQVFCFGNFAVKTMAGEEIHFERKKSKELFAYLIHKKGTECTLKEAAAILFEDEVYDEKLQNYMQKIISVMMKALRKYGVEEVIQKEFNSMKIDTEKIECDYYHFVQVGAELDFEQEQAYLENYAWAEFF